MGEVLSWQGLVDMHEPHGPRVQTLPDQLASLQNSAFPLIRVERFSTLPLPSGSRLPTKHALGWTGKNCQGRSVKPRNTNRNVSGTNGTAACWPWTFGERSCRAGRDGPIAQAMMLSRQPSAQPKRMFSARHQRAVWNALARAERRALRTSVGPALRRRAARAEAPPAAPLARWR